MKALTCAFLILLCSALCITPATAQYIPQRISIASSPNPVGSGARAVGMGGAFIAVADDATAASWNPAGLTQLRKPEFSFALSYFKRREDFCSRSHPESEGLQEVRAADLNYASIAYPFELLRRNMIVSLNYQRLYEFDRDIHARFTTRSLDAMLFANQNMAFRQQGKLCAVAPAYAIQLTPDLALGVAFNIWTDKLFWSNGWESDTVINGSFGRPGKPLSYFKERDRDRYSGFSGFNLHIGLLWNINRYVTIGGVVKTPFTGRLRHERTVHTTVATPYISGCFDRQTVRINEHVDLHMPLSFGLGIAIRLSDALTLSGDVYRTEWSHFILEDGNGRRISPITGERSYASNIHPTHQIRLGAEYLIILSRTVVPLRCGLFYDPEPSQKSPEDYWGFALGTGVSIGHVILDFSYQHRRGKSVEGDVLNIPSTNADVSQHLFMASAIYHF